MLKIRILMTLTFSNQLSLLLVVVVAPLLMLVFIYKVSLETVVIDGCDIVVLFCIIFIGYKYVVVVVINFCCLLVVASVESLVISLLFS